MQNNIQVWKFGGTSVGKPERMKSIRTLTTADSGRKIVVLSALSGTTNALVAIGQALFAKDKELALVEIEKLYLHYLEFIGELFEREDSLEKGKKVVENEFNFIRSLAGLKHYTQKHDKEMIAQGEIMSTQLFTAYMKEQGESVVLIPALSFMRIDADNEPEFNTIETKLNDLLADQENKQIVVTQGFICRNPRGEVDNLKRGGSDYTASLIGACINAEEIQIWTDIDGMHNNDPRIVKRTKPVRELSFEEAAELAYFGAKILHPSTINPAKKRGVPVRLKNTMAPDAPGTLITSDSKNKADVKAIAAKDGVTAIYIHSTRMLNAYGFLRKVFDIFERFKTPVDMITTSEVSVAVTIDNSENLEHITKMLSQIAELEEHDRNQSIICIVGDFLADKEGIAIKILEAVRHIPIRMISYGASEHNMSLLIDSKHKNDALEALNEKLFTFD
ncbi:aspartate kinase [Spirosomataceae bacterium TFI 002]|nr:aspartate kinase [Spirosomataceae bacterium TFI 002]